jgi:MFS family permease
VSEGRPDRRYETIVLLILSFVNGIIALDRLAVNFLSPYIIADLGLSNAQLGLLSSALSGAISISGLLVAAIADATGKPKKILVGMLIAFSALSSGSGLAFGFAGLFGARLLLGFAEGPLTPLTQTIMSATSTSARRGFNMGAMQIGGSFLIGAMLGPPLMVALAEAFSWRVAFFVSAIPGLIGAFLVWRIVQERAVAPAGSELTPLASFAELLKSRNLVLCMIIAAVFTAWVTIQNVFMPRFLVDEDGFSKPMMGWLLSMTGFGGLAGGVLIPALSDRFGRKPLVFLTCLACLISPLALLFVPHSAPLLAVLLGVGWLTVGCAPLVLAIIPGESVPVSRMTTAVALATSSAELFGGMLSPPIAGWSADQWGLRAPFWIDVGLALLCAALGLLLRETLSKP